MDAAGPHCPTPDPAEWDGKEHVWVDRTFLRRTYRAIMYRPLDMERSTAEAVAAAGRSARPGGRVMVVTRARGPFRGDLLVSADAADPGAEVERITARYFSRLWTGHYSSIPGFVRRTALEASRRYGGEPEDVLTWVATCPRCASARGSVDVVVLARSDP